jgi:hypothetical protein
MAQFPPPFTLTPSRLMRREADKLSMELNVADFPCLTRRAPEGRPPEITPTYIAGTEFDDHPATPYPPIRV